MGLSMRHVAVLIILLGVTACIPPARDVYAPSPPRPQLSTDPAVLGTSPEDAPPASWQATKVTANSRSVGSAVYLVQPGDTLRGIANKTGAGSQIIAAANGLVEPYVIHPGQRLEITGGRYHTVNTGETGIAIAQAYGAPWRELVILNNLEEPYVLRVGQKLLLPSTAPVDPANLSIEERAAAFDLDIDDIVTGSQPALAARADTTGASDWRKAIAPKTPVSAPAGFAGTFQWPVEGTVISSFGSKGGGKVNDGLNIGVAKAYGHADKLNVTRGQNVKAGQVIGLAGESGYVQEPQLHFEIRKNRKPVDPKIHLPKRG